MRTRLLMSLLLTAAAPLLPPSLNAPNTTEGWIWQQVQAGEVADLNDRCKTPPLDIHKREDARWRAPCRRVSPDLLRALLTQSDLADHSPHGVQIRGARIDGSLNLDDAHVRAAEVELDGSWIAGDAVLSDARLDGLLSLDGTLIEGNLNGQRAFIGSHLTMQGAELGGPVDLRDAHVDGQMAIVGASVADKQTFNAERLHVGAGGLFLRNVTFGGPVVLRDAHVDGQMDMQSASIADKQKFDAERLHVGAGGLILPNVTFGGPVVLRDAHVDGQMSMQGASIADKQAFDAERLHVGAGGLYFRNLKFGGPVDLADAHVDGQVDMEGASVADKQKFDAEGLHVGAGGLFLRSVAFGGPVVLRGAHVEGQMDMEGARVAHKQTFDAEALHVGAGGLFLRNMTFGGPVALTSANAEGQMDMDGASIADQQALVMERLHVGSNFFARSVTFGGPVNFETLIVDGDLDLRDSHVRQLDLEGAAIRGDVRLGGRDSDGSEHWLHWDSCDVGGPRLNLRNARIGNLQDDDLAWPAHITLEGFSYTRLGGIGGEQRQDMRSRPIGWWRGWLSRDPVYSAQPYAQLAGVLAASGNRDGAADIRFFGRDRERSELLRGCTWLQAIGIVEKPADDRPCRWGAGLGLSALQLFVGYGIGAYSFRAAGWGLILAAAGTIILCFAPGVRGVRPPNWTVTKARRGRRQKSLLWCFGASLQRVLPLVTFSAEFSDFFNDPRRERLRSWQHVAFGVLVLCGWALGLFVAAAFSGLIQS